MKRVGKNNPTITVLIPVFNREAWLSSCIMSVLGQIGVDLDIRIVDDCSTDASLTVAKRLAAIDGRITVSKTEANSGSPDAAINYIFTNCNSEYVCWIGSDDSYSHELSLAKMIAQLEACNAHYVYPNFKIVGDESLFPRAYGAFRESNVNTYFTTFFERQIPEIPWNGVWRTEFLKSIDTPWPVHPYALSSSDCLNGLRLYSKGLLTTHIPEDLITYTYHSEMGTNNARERCASLGSKLKYFWSVVPLDLADTLLMPYKQEHCSVQAHSKVQIERYRRHIAYEIRDQKAFELCNNLLDEINTLDISNIYKSRVQNDI